MGTMNLKPYEMLLLTARGSVADTGVHDLDSFS